MAVAVQSSAARAADHISQAGNRWTATEHTGSDTVHRRPATPWRDRLDGTGLLEDGCINLRQ